MTAPQAYLGPSTSLHSAGNAFRDVLTIRSILAASDVDVCPSPVIAGTLTALDVNVDGVLVYSACDVLQHKVANNHAIGGLPIDAVI